MRQIEDKHALSELDRSVLMPRLANYVARNCDNGPPRAGMGKEL